MPQLTTNPFKPTAGMNPPELIGRDLVLEEFIEGMAEGAGAPGRLMRITGARGMGKTVVLNEIGQLARDARWLVIDETASPQMCSNIMARLTPDAEIEHVVAAPSLLGASVGSIEIDRRELTLRELLAHAIQKNGTGLLITVDEVQDATLDQMRMLAVAIQHLIREGRDIAFVFAGLPSMIDNVINGKTLTFLRRAVPFELGEVGSREVSQSFTETFNGFGMAISGEMADVLSSASHGYPFMIQLVGYHVWRATRRACLDEVSEATANAGIAAAHDRFEHMVVEPVLQRLSRRSIEYLLAMAEDEDGASSTSAVASRMGMRPKQLSGVRAQLIDESVIESVSWGEVAFAIPYMADYLNAHRLDIKRRMGRR